MSWLPFSPDDVAALTASPRSPADNSERQCPCCGKPSVRFYFHESRSARRIGTSWWWCADCQKYIHFTGAPLSDDFDFDDPYDASFETAERRGGSAWYEFLDRQWCEGTLPQTFKPK